MRRLPPRRGLRAARPNGGGPWTVARLREALPWIAGRAVLDVFVGPHRVQVVTRDGDYAEVDSVDVQTGTPSSSLTFNNASLAKLMARHYAEETAPSTAEILGAVGVREPEAFARARMAPLKAAILREMRAMRLYPYQGWDDVREALGDEFTDGVFDTRGTPRYGSSRLVRLFDEDPEPQSLLYGAMVREIEEWMHTDAVEALKRLGARAFDPEGGPRSNPARRGGADAWTTARVRNAFPTWWDAGGRLLAVFDGVAGVAFAVDFYGAPEVFALDRATGSVQTLRRGGLTIDAAKLWAKHHAAGTEPTAAEILGAYGVPDARAFAAVRMAPLKARIMREFRAVRLFPSQDWDELRKGLPEGPVADVFSVAEAPPYPEAARAMLSSRPVQKDLSDALGRDIAEWARSGAVRELKRLGPRAFAPDEGDDGPRKNPSRRRRRNPPRRRSRRV